MDLKKNPAHRIAATPIQDLFTVVECNSVFEPKLNPAEK